MLFSPSYEEVILMFKGQIPIFPNGGVGVSNEQVERCMEALRKRDQIYKDIQMIASENVNRLYISVCGVIAQKKKTSENVEFWVNQYKGTDGHEVTDEEAQRVVDQIKKVFEIK